MFDIGQNDLGGDFDSMSSNQVLDMIQTILAEFEAGVKVCSSSLIRTLNMFVATYQQQLLLFSVLKDVLVFATTTISAYETKTWKKQQLDFDAFQIFC